MMPKVLSVCIYVEPHAGCGSTIDKSIVRLIRKSVVAILDRNKPTRIIGSRLRTMHVNDSSRLQHGSDISK
jgi:hypothetical protein